MTIEELEMKLSELDGLRTETNKRIEELNKQIAELKKQGEEKPKPPHPRPYPENDQFYYYVNATGGVNETKWNADHFDLDACEIGNAFVTQAEAEFAAERLKVLAEMREWAGEWRNEYNLTWDNDHDKIIIHVSLFYHGELCFATYEDAENCIKAVGEDRIKKYYFMVSEEAHV